MPSMPVQPPEWIDAAPTIAESSVEIDAPASAVWPHIADHESWPTWFRQIKKIERIGEGAGVGSGRRVSIGLVTVDEEFTAWDVDEHFAFAVVKSPIPILKTMAESVRLEALADDRCRVTYRQGLEGRAGCGWLVGRVGNQMQGQTGAALAALKALVEAD